MFKKIITILYNNNETKIEINLNEVISLSSLKEKILSFLKETNDSSSYNLMSINTSNPYTLLDEENYSQILKEEIVGEDLKLFLNKNNIDIDDSNNINMDINKDNNKIEENLYDNNDDDDLVIEKEEEENSNNNINNNDEINQLKINENINDNNINNENKIENDNKDLFNETDELMKKIDKLLDNNNNDFPMLKHSKTLNVKKFGENDIQKENNKKINNIIENDNKNYINSSNQSQNTNEINKIDSKDNKNFKQKLNENPIMPKFRNINTFESLICDICKMNLSDIKYICCICENCNLCEECEKNHYHPCIKLKLNFLSNIQDIYKFISTFYSFKLPSKNFFSKIFTKEYEIKLKPLSDKKVCFRPKKSFNFYIRIENLSGNELNSSQFELIPKNNKLIKITNSTENFKLLPNTHNYIKLKCRTANNKGEENVEFYLFSENLCFKNQEELFFSINFIINDDWNEEEINLELEYNDYIMMYNKEHKKLAVEIIKNLENVKHKYKLKGNKFFKKVFDTLASVNWDKKSALNKLKKMNL